MKRTRSYRTVFALSVIATSAALLAGCSDSDDDDAPAPTETPAGTLEDMPAGTPAETPAGTPAETPAGTPAETPAGTPAETPAGTPTEMPAGTPTEMPAGTPTDTPSMPPATATGALAASDLAGTWNTGCLLDDPEDPDSEYESASVTFSGDDFTFTGDSYSDAGCTQSLDEEADLAGTFTLGTVVITTDGLNATEIDLDAAESGSTDTVTVLDLVLVDGQSLYFANGDFGELDDIVGQPRPDSLELDEPYMRQP